MALRPQAADQEGTATLRRTGLPVQQPAPEPRGGTQCDYPAVVRPHGRHILHPQPVPLRFRVADFNRGGLYGEFQPHNPRRSARDHRQPRIHRPQRGHLHRDARPAARPAQRGRHALASYHHRRQRLDRRQLRGHAGRDDRRRHGHRRRQRRNARHPGRGHRLRQPVPGHPARHRGRPDHGGRLPKKRPKRDAFIRPTRRP